MKIKKNYQNPKTTKRQKEQKKEVEEYKGLRLDALSTACVVDDLLSNRYFWNNSAQTITLFNGKEFEIREKVD